MRPIWPDVATMDRDLDQGLTTFIRKNHEGVWYLCQVTKFWRGEGAYGRQHYLSFIHDVYAQMVIGLVDPNLVFPDGSYAHIKDPDQRDEVERLMRLM